MGAMRNNGFVVVEGADRLGALLDSILTSDPTMDKLIRKVVRKVLAGARGKISRDAKGYMMNDPRHAYKAVMRAVYKRAFGGDVNILKRRKAGGTRAELLRDRKLDYNPHQRGGNRRKRSGRTIQLDSYYGADRGFILRFLSSGTTTRMTRYGNRGAIRATGWFGHVAAWHMETAVEELSNAVVEYINEQANG